MLAPRPIRRTHHPASTHPARAYAKRITPHLHNTWGLGPVESDSLGWEAPGRAGSSVELDFHAEKPEVSSLISKVIHHMPRQRARAWLQSLVATMASLLKGAAPN